MTIEILEELIGTYAFPVIACIVMGWFVKYMYDKGQQQVDSLNAAHKEEQEKILEAVNNNTLIVTKLYEKMEAWNK